MVHIALAIYDCQDVLLRPLQHKLHYAAMFVVSHISIAWLLAIILAIPFLVVLLVKEDYQYSSFKGCGSGALPHTLAHIIPVFYVPVSLLCVLFVCSLKAVKSQTLLALSLAENTSNSTSNGDVTGIDSLEKRSPSRQNSGDSSPKHEEWLESDLEVNIKRKDLLTVEDDILLHRTARNSPIIGKVAVENVHISNEEPRDDTQASQDDPPPTANNSNSTFPEIPENEFSDKKELIQNEVSLENKEERLEAIGTEAKTMKTEEHMSTTTKINGVTALNPAKVDNQHCGLSPPRGMTVRPKSICRKSPAQGDSVIVVPTNPAQGVTDNQEDTESCPQQSQVNITVDNVTTPCDENTTFDVSDTESMDGSECNLGDGKKATKELLTVPLEENDILLELERDTMRLIDDLGMPGPLTGMGNPAYLDRDGTEVNEEDTSLSNAIQAKRPEPEGQESDGQEDENDSKGSEKNQSTAETSRRSSVSTEGPGVRRSRSILRDGSRRGTNRKSVKFANSVAFHTGPKKRINSTKRCPAGSKKQKSSSQSDKLTRNGSLRNPNKIQRQTSVVDAQQNKQLKSGSQEKDTPMKEESPVDFLSQMQKKHGARITRRVREQQETIQLLAVIFTCYIVLSLPHHLLWTVKAICSSCVDNSAVVIVVLEWLYNSTSFVNPFIYILVNPEFRKSTLRLFSRRYI